MASYPFLFLQTPPPQSNRASSLPLWQPRGVRWPLPPDCAAVSGRWGPQDAACLRKARYCCASRMHGCLGFAPGEARSSGRPPPSCVGPSSG
eukprot:scaffold167589_cov34-Prasinocladus_malaysianus.AAC.1